MNLKNQVIMVGMSRAGTTFMYHNLQKHPQIFVPVRKEIGYFAHHHQKGTLWYESFYEGSNPQHIVTDICGVYFSDDDALNRIYEYNPDAKIILSIRNPVDWIFSFYEQYKGSYNVPPFKEFLKGCSIMRESQSIRLNFTNQKISKTIAGYREKFGDNLLIYDFSYFASDNLKILQSIEIFLDIDPFFKEGNFTNQKINARGRKKSALFEKMLQKQWFVNMILTCFSKRMILRLRAIWEKNSAVNESQPNINFNDDERLLVEEIFEKDVEYISQLFREGPILLGSGKSVES